MKPRNAFLISALIYLVATLGAARLARVPTDLAHGLAAALVAGCIVLSAAIMPARTYSRRALLGAGGILAACMVLPLFFVADPADWLRQTPAIMGYLWLWMMLLGLSSSSPSRRAWCTSSLVVVLASAILGGGVVLSALW